MKCTRFPFPRLGSFFWNADGDHLKLLRSFNEWGLTTAQLGDPFLTRAIKEPEYRKTLLKDFEAAGVQIAGIACYRNIVSLDPKARRENLDALTAALKVAPELGTFAVATETGTFNRESDWSPAPENISPAAWQAVTDSIGELVEVAESAGSILAIEGYVNNIVGRLYQLEALFDLFPSRNLGLVLDPYNYITRDLLPAADEICTEFIETYADRFVFAHLKDVAPLGADGVAEDEARADLVGTPEFCTGVFPQQPYLRFLRDRRPDLAILFEHLPDEHLPAAVERFCNLVGCANPSK